MDVKFIYLVDLTMSKKGVDLKIITCLETPIYLGMLVTCDIA